MTPKDCRAKAGHNVEGIVRASMPQIMKQMVESLASDKHLQLDEDAMNAALANVPTDPDEELR